jgi:two-component system chemotaxis response regulator CheY
MIKILLVDDSPTMRSIEKNVLRALGDVEFAEAADGFEALIALAWGRNRFDLVLIDWNMPNLSGGELLCRIREKDQTTPLVMVTTQTEKARVVSALKAGANGYLIKPFKPDVLLERARQVMAEATRAAAVG